MSMLSCRDVVMTAGGRRLLGPLSATFKAGAVTAVLGPNGAGKSTWLAALAGVARPASGQVILGDADMAGLDPLVRARRLGFMVQSRDIAWGVSVETLVGLGRIPHHRYVTLDDTTDAAMVAAALERCDLEALRQRDVLTLSGGERARVLLARVLAGGPDWVLADEPLAGLDPAYQLEIVRLLRGLADEGRGVVVTLHDLTLAGRFADRVMLLKDGRLVAEGPPDDVLTPGMLGDVYGVGVEVLTASDGARVVMPTRRTPRE
ncbi:ABC transporter ATP-binding protein [Parapedomonas caeni]